jgi:DNA repair photolyase
VRDEYTRKRVPGSEERGGAFRTSGPLTACYTIRDVAISVREIAARSVLSKSGIPGIDYCVNPYTGCAHACRYCYATFMKRFSGHAEAWGTFVDVKVNAPHLLTRQLRRARPGTIVLSSVTDPYQPVEARYKVTRSCLEALAPYPVEVHVLTKSPLVLRDMDVLKNLRNVSVGITITTDDDRVRRLFEPKAPPIARRLHALKELHEHGISTYAFVGPLLPMNPEVLARALLPCVDSVLIDRMNYASKTRPLFRSQGLEQWLDDGFVDDVTERLARDLERHSVEVCRV